MSDAVLSAPRGFRNAVFSIWSLIILIPALVLLLDPTNAGAVLGTAGHSFLGTLPFVVFAVVSIAYLKATGAEAVVAAAFHGREVRMILLAAVVGGMAPFCSCEVVPFIAGLLAVGVPVSAVMAFWLASPLMDPPTLMITAGALGWEFAIGKAIAAVALGLIGGFGVRFLVNRGAFADPLRPRDTAGGCGCSEDACGPNSFEGKPQWRFWRTPERVALFRTELISNSLFLVKWLGFAYLLEGLLVTYVPADLIGSLVGGSGFGPILIGALVGIPAYVNGYAAPALVSGLMEQGMSAGAAMSFLVGGAVTCIPAMAAIWSLVRPALFWTYLAIGMAGAMVMGVVFAAVVA